MGKGVLLSVFMVVGYCSLAFASALSFEWNGSGTSWTSSSSWNETGGSGSYPGASGRTTDIVTFGISGSFVNQPTLASSLTVASIEFGGSYQVAGAQLTVNSGVTLTAGTITQDPNLTSYAFTIFDYLQGGGTINCTTINVGSGTINYASNNFLLSDVGTLNVSGNVNIVANANIQNGCGFRLENGNMYLAGQVKFTILSGISASNACYFTINTVAQAGGNTTPHLYLANPNPLPSIPTPNASVNFYGDRGGAGTVSYTAASPTVYTTSTPGFGSGGGTIDTTKSSYDYLTIQGTGTATIGGSTVGALKVTGDLTTASPTTFSSLAATNTSVGGNWINTSTVNATAGTTAVSGNMANSGTMNMGSGSTDVGGNLANSATFVASSGNIQVDGSVTNSSTLTLGSGSFTIKSNYTNSGTFTAGSGPVNFSGSSAQSLVDNSASGTTLNNVNFSGGGTKTLSGTGSFAISSSGVLTMAASNMLATGGILTLNSSSTGSATVAAIPSTASITGTVNVQRYISGGNNSYRGYRLLSSAVYTVKSGSNLYYDLSYLPLYAPITGTGGTAGGLTKSGNPSIYLYRDNVAFTNSTFNTGNFRGINKINNSPLYAIGVDFDGTYNLHAGTGIMFFYRGNLSNIATKYITSTSAEANVFTSTGTLNQQAVTFVNWYTGLSQLQYSVVTGNAGYSGYNLLGNPYASSIDWNTYSTSNPAAGIYAPNVGNTIYIFNEVAKTYATYSGGVGANGGTNIIPSGQGFFVKANSTGTPTVTFNEAAKTNSQLAGPTQSTGSTLLLSSRINTKAVINNPLQDIRLELAADSINKEETVLKFDNNAKNEYVFNEDAQYLPSTGSVSLSSMTADNMPVIINDLPLPKTTQKISLNINVSSSGTYTLSRTELNNIPNLFELWLMDAYKRDSLDIKHNSTYKFDVVKSDTNSYGLKRFSLVVRQNPALGVHLLSFSGSKNAKGALIAWKTENEADYTSFNLERSIDGGATFHTLNAVTSSSASNYSYLDENPPIASDQYRLKLTDLNGSVTYSSVVTLMYANTAATIASSGISIYPNPTKGSVNLQILSAENVKLLSLQSLSTNTPVATSTAVYDIKIVNNTGSVIKTATTTQQEWQTDLSSLVPGTYIIQVINVSNNNVVGKGTFIKL